jgi:hypothetical protein
LRGFESEKKIFKNKMWKFSVILVLTVLGGYARGEEETQTKNGNNKEEKKVVIIIKTKCEEGKNEYNCVG